MGAGRGQSKRIKASASISPPDVLPGDWVKITTSSPGAAVPVQGQRAEILDVDKDHHGNALLDVIVEGRISTALYWSYGDRWEKILPPTDLPPSYVRSPAAPGANLPTANSWISRPCRCRGNCKPPPPLTRQKRETMISGLVIWRR